MNLIDISGFFATPPPPPSPLPAPTPDDTPLPQFDPHRLDCFKRCMEVCLKICETSYRPPVITISLCAPSSGGADAPTIQRCKQECPGNCLQRCAWRVG